MKKFIVLIIVWAACTRCTAPENTVDSDMVVAIDRTDPLTSYPAAQAILAPLTAHPYSGLRVRLTAISDRDINDDTVVTLHTARELTSNPNLRSAEVAAFTQSVQQAIERMRTGGTCPHSIIYRAIGRQLNRLARSPAAHKYLLVYSNLYEHAEVDFYDHHVLQLVKSNPAIIQQRLQAQLPLSPLKGIDVWLLYSPSSYQDNETYMTVARLYETLLQSKGAIVHIDKHFALP